MGILWGKLGGSRRISRRRRRRIDRKGEIRGLKQLNILELLGLSPCWVCATDPDYSVMECYGHSLGFKTVWIAPGNIQIKDYNFDSAKGVLFLP